MSRSTPISSRPGTKRLIRHLKSWFPRRVPVAASFATKHRRSSSFPLRRLWLVPLIVIFIISLVYYILYHLLVIKHISCNLNHQPCADVFVAQLNYHLNTPIITADFTPSLTKIQGFDPSIIAIHHQYLPPATINFDLQSSPPLAQITSSTSSAVIIITKNHTLSQYSKAPEPNLTLLVASSAAGLEVGTSVTDHNLITALNLVELLHNYYLRVPTIYINQPDKSILILPSGPVVYLSLFQDLETQVKALSLILGKLPPDDQVISIDLRPTNPIIARPAPQSPASSSALIQ